MDDLAFRFDTGATWLNLLATRGRSFSAHPVERLATVDLLGEWLACSELTPGRRLTPADLDLALTLRETLRDLAMATVTGERPPPAAARRIAEFLAAQDDPVRLTVTDRVVRRPPATATAALARIARQAVDHLTGPERHTLVLCDEQDCRGVFADPTGRRRWCPAPACASRGRVRAMRERRRAEA
ncbi:hypothetical protein F0L68_24635 [Solihabitans fulvus]|uniref:Zinc finger CGNR domain-containing protein n=1 Tax=Solihabitans fulvus TaxID=1892852 RepID=A0A5B2X3P0_9PSEU|nr:CGNR zinc finger domain-containing protein [Solihabitans fulvus]KAA2257908.1 hypothetical protein F0L68_24635 [Solihabitans fulvus]